MSVTVGSRTFRFGVVTTPQSDGEQWLATARRVAELGYSSLLMPDGLQLPAPIPSLAIAATAADIRVGTWVLAAPLRPARLAAWEAHTMTTLTGGRFELGVGTGRPVVEQWARAMGLPFGTPAERLTGVQRLIATLRELDGEGQHTPVTVAAGGPRALLVAAEQADIVTLAVGALTPREEIAAMFDRVRRHAGSRDPELVMSLFVVGSELPPHAERYIGADLATLRSAGSLALLEGSPREMADELERRRERFGTSYVTVNGEFIEQFAPVVGLLAGK